MAHNIYTCTHIHIYMYTYIHMYTYTDIYTHISMYIHIHIDFYIYTYIWIHIYIYIQTLSPRAKQVHPGGGGEVTTLKHKNALNPLLGPLWEGFWGASGWEGGQGGAPTPGATYTHIHTYTHTHVHTYTYTHIHKYTNTQIHIYTDTQIHIYTYTHVHIYTYTSTWPILLLIIRITYNHSFMAHTTNNTTNKNNNTKY